jgi:N-methylhydantoinase A
MGLIGSDVAYEYGKSDHLIVSGDLDRINANFASLVDKAIADLRSAGFDEQTIKVTRSLDIRYRYQVHELNVPLASGMSRISADEMEQAYSRFDELYEQTYGAGSGYRDAGKEIMVFRVIAVGEIEKPNIKRYPVKKESADKSLKGKREIYFDEYSRSISTNIYDFSRMTSGTEISGPAIIETPITTIVINPNDSATIDEFLNVRISIATSMSE